MLIWCRMENISWTEHVSNEEVLKLVEEERSLLMTIRMRQRNWMGHIMRGDLLQREIIDGRMEGKRRRGKPKQNYWTGWSARDTPNLRKKLNIEKRGAIWGLDLPEGRELRSHPFMTSTRRGGGGSGSGGRGRGVSPMWTSTQKIKIRVHWRHPVFFSCKEVCVFFIRISSFNW